MKQQEAKQKINQEVKQEVKTETNKIEVNQEAKQEKVQLPENANRPLKPGEKYTPILKPNQNYPEVTPYSVLMGVLMFAAEFLPAFKSSALSGKVESRIKPNTVGSLLLGAVLSLAFCPTNAALFFGMVAQPNISIWHIIFFAIIVALPVLVIAWILAFSYDSISRFYDRVRHIGKWFRWGVGALFIALGLFFIFEHLCEA